jgi:hypothetical protein
VKALVFVSSAIIIYSRLKAAALVLSLFPISFKVDDNTVLPIYNENCF